MEMIRDRVPSLPTIVLPGLTRVHALLIVAVIAVFLPLDMHLDLPGQAVLSFAVWGVLFYVLAPMRPRERWILWACVVIATAGELALSLMWGLYTYRLGNIPFFVPAGHALLLALAFAAAPRVPRVAADVVMVMVVVYALITAALGVDTFGLVLLVLLAVLALGAPAHRPLFATSFLLALAMELYGTMLGNWTWVHQVPMLPLVTTNPPGLAGVFYVALDVLVAFAASTALSPRRPQAACVDPSTP